MSKYAIGKGLVVHFVACNLLHWYKCSAIMDRPNFPFQPVSWLSGGYGPSKSKVCTATDHAPQIPKLPYTFAANYSPPTIYTSSPFLYTSGAFSSFQVPRLRYSPEFPICSPNLLSRAPPLRSFLSLNSPQISLSLSNPLSIYRIVSILQGKFCVLAKISTLGFFVLQITQLGFSQIDEIFDLAPRNLLFRSLLRNFGA